MTVKLLNLDHPLCEASIILRRLEKDLYFAPRNPRQRDRDRIRRHRDILAHAQEHIAAQIRDTPECWSER